jgi:hypothetical protein
MYMIVEWTPQDAKNQGEADKNTGKKADTTGKPVGWINSSNEGYQQ